MWVPSQQKRQNWAEREAGIGAEASAALENQGWGLQSSVTKAGHWPLYPVNLSGTEGCYQGEALPWVRRLLLLRTFPGREGEPSGPASCPLGNELVTASGDMAASTTPRGWGPSKVLSANAEIASCFYSFVSHIYFILLGINSGH